MVAGWDSDKNTRNEHPLAFLPSNAFLRASMRRRRKSVWTYLEDILMLFGTETVRFFTGPSRWLYQYLAWPDLSYVKSSSHQPLKPYSHRSSRVQSRPIRFYILPNIDLNVQVNKYEVRSWLRNLTWRTKGWHYLEVDETTVGTVISWVSYQSNSSILTLTSASFQFIFVYFLSDSIFRLRSHHFIVT